MTIQTAVLCDAAADYNGKLNLLGTFDTIFAAQFPVLHPQCSIALRIVFDRIEEGKHEIRINFVDEDGKPIIQNMPPMPVDVGFPADATFISRNFVINFQQLKFEQDGLYSVDIAVDGRQTISIPLAVRKVTPPPAAEF